MKNIRQSPQFCTFRRPLLWQRGFTLIELMIVVAIIAVISGILLPRVLSLYDKAKKTDLETAVPEQQQKSGAEEFTPPKGVPPVIETVNLNLSLESTYHRVGMEVYTRYEAQCKGNLVFRRAAQDENPVLLTIPLPEGKAEARDVRLTLTHKTDGTTWEPDNLVYHDQRLYWSGDLPADETFIAEINFVALGRDQFEYRLPPARQLRALEIVVALTGQGTPRIPNHALQPTEMTDQELFWKFNHLITDRAVIIDIPGALSPLARVLLLVRLMAVAVLLFGFGFWYLSAPGQLKDFRWGHFLLLALTYSLYFVIFAVISFRENVNPWLAMVIAALFSLPLLVLHVTRVLNLTFATRRALPLAIFTLVLVINGVYGGAARDYLFIAAAVGVIAFFTVTYQKWYEGRTAYQKQQRTENEKRVEALRAKLLDEVKQKLDETQVADLEAERLIETSTQTELEAERYILEQKREPVADLLKQYKDLLERLPNLRFVSDTYDAEWYDSFGREIEQLGKENKRILKILRTAIETLQTKKQTLRAQHGEQDVYCVACGHVAPPSPYCKQCGAPRAQDLTCRECGERLLLPVHLLAEETETITLYCPHCGEPHEPVMLQTSEPFESPQGDHRKKKGIKKDKP